MIEGSGAEFVPRTNRSGFGRPKNIRIRSGSATLLFRTWTVFPRSGSEYLQIFTKKITTALKRIANFTPGWTVYFLIIGTVFFKEPLKLNNTLPLAYLKIKRKAFYENFQYGQNPDTVKSRSNKLAEVVIKSSVSSL